MGRMEKVNNQMKRAISLIIQQELADPRMGFVTITHVDVSPDLKNAKVYFSVLGEERQLNDAQKSLTNARGMIRYRVSQQMQIKHTPELHFIHDKSISMSEKIEETIRETKDDKEKN